MGVSDLCFKTVLGNLLIRYGYADVGLDTQLHSDFVSIIFSPYIRLFFGGFGLESINVLSFLDAIFCFCIIRRVLVNSEIYF